MKKCISLIIVSLSILMLVSCGSKSIDSNSSPASEQTKQESSNSSQPIESPQNNKKTVEEWKGGKEAGYLCKSEEYDENGELIKATEYSKEGTVLSTEEWEINSETYEKTSIKKEYKSLSGDVTFFQSKKINSDNKMVEQITDDPTGMLMVKYRVVFEFNGEGNKAKETEYDKEGNVVETIEYQYDSNNNMTASLRNGQIYTEWKYDYDENNNILNKWKKRSIDNDFELVEKFEYAAEGYLFKKVEYINSGQRVTYTYNQNGILIDEYGYPHSDDTLIHKIYNEESGKIEKETETTNHTKTTDYIYNDEGDLIKKTWYDDWDGGSSGLTEYVVTYWNR